MMSLLNRVCRQLSGISNALKARARPVSAGEPPLIKQTLELLMATLPEPEDCCQFIQVAALPQSPLKASIKQLLLAVRQIDFSRRLLDSVILQRPFLLDVGDAQVRLQCRFSVMSDPTYNFLIGHLDDTVILIGQHVSSADFLYFPEHQLLAKLFHINEERTAAALKRLKTKLVGFTIRHNYPAGRLFNAVARFKMALTGPSPHQSFRFGGVIASHSRPAHFFYDCVLSTQDIVENFHYPEPLPVYQLKRGDFARLGAIYGTHFFSERGVVCYDRINQVARSQAQFFIKLGVCYRDGNLAAKALLRRFDGLLQAAALQRHQQTQDPFIHQVQQYKQQGFFLLWHGVTTEKRRWVEQDQAIVALVNALRLNGKKVCLLVDGWTVPETPAKADAAQIASDTEVFNAIKAALPKDVPCLSLIGQVPLCKTAIAELIDFHVSNGGTGSLYVSRVAKKPGVLHIGNRTRPMTRLAIHFNSEFVPSERVVDLPGDGPQRMDFVSYSIQPQDFVQFAMGVNNRNIAPG